MWRLFSLIVLLAGALFPASSATAAPAPGSDDSDHTGIGVRLVDAPVATRDDPRARVYVIDHVSPGTLIERRIEVSNDSGASAQIEVYAAGATIKSGAFVGLEGKTPNEVSSWTTLKESVLELDDGASALIPVTIRVPADAAPGEQYAVIWAQTSSAAKNSSGVTQVSRVGIRVYLSVGPGGEPASDFEVESLTPGRDVSGHPVLQAAIHNTGGRALDLSGSLRLTDGPGGLSAGPYPVTLGTTLAVGETELVNIELDDQLPNGPWRAKVTVTSGLLTRSGQATITFPEAGAGEKVTVEAAIGWWWWVGGVGLGAVLLVSLGWLVFRKGRRERRLRVVAGRTEVAA